MHTPMRARDSCGPAATAAAAFLIRLPRWSRYQKPTRPSTTMPMTANSANQMTWAWPLGMTSSATSSGPIAWPVLPPTWKKDWAKP